MQQKTDQVAEESLTIPERVWLRELDSRTDNCGSRRVSRKNDSPLREKAAVKFCSIAEQGVKKAYSAYSPAL